MRRAAPYGALGGAVFVLAIGVACGSVTEAGPGGECFVATDCAVGLVCVEQANKTRVCSSDLSRIAGKAPPEGGPDDGGDAAPSEGGPEDPDGGTAADADEPDVVTPPKDSGADTAPADTGVKDTGPDVTPPPE